MTLVQRRKCSKSLRSKYLHLTFGTDQEKAQKILRQRSRIEKQMESQTRFETALSDAEVLFEFAKTDADSATELGELIVGLEKRSRRRGNEESAVRRKRSKQCDLLDSGRGGRYRRPGLGSDVDENVPPLGFEQWIQGRNSGRTVGK